MALTVPQPTPDDPSDFRGDVTGVAYWFVPTSDTKIVRMRWTTTRNFWASAKWLLYHAASKELLMKYGRLTVQAQESAFEPNTSGDITLTRAGGTWDTWMNAEYVQEWLLAKAYLVDFLHKHGYEPTMIRRAASWLADVGQDLWGLPTAKMVHPDPKFLAAAASWAIRLAPVVGRYAFDALMVAGMLGGWGDPAEDSAPQRISFSIDDRKWTTDRLKWLIFLAFEQGDFNEPNLVLLPGADGIPGRTILPIHGEFRAGHPETDDFIQAPWTAQIQVADSAQHGTIEPPEASAMEGKWMGLPKPVVIAGGAALAAGLAYAVWPRHRR